MTTKPKVTPKAKPAPASPKKPAGVKPSAPKKAKVVGKAEAPNPAPNNQPKKAPKPKAKTGRPSAYSDAVASKLCDLIASGLSLRKACELEGMPNVSTVIRWLADESRAEFCAQYMRAREAQADHLAEEMLTIADEAETTVRGEDVVFDSTAVARNRLRVDTRKWLASKMAPKKYGDKITAEHTGADGGALQVQSTVTFVMPTVRPDDES